MTNLWRAVFVFLSLASTPALADVPDMYRQSYVMEAKGDYVGAVGRMEEIRKRGR